MITRFVCLANSIKHGGRCIAGIQLDNSNQPITSNGRPVWIRPVGAAGHGEVLTHMVTRFNLLDIVQLDITGRNPEGHQSENVRFIPSSLGKIGTLSKQSLDSLCDAESPIFGNRGKAVSPEAVNGLQHSLMLIKVSEGQITSVTYPDRPGKPQVRFEFFYNGDDYDLPITDPAFIERYNHNPNILADIPFCHLCLSLGTLHEGWYYKLVAGVIM